MKMCLGYCVSKCGLLDDARQGKVFYTFLPNITVPLVSSSQLSWIMWNHVLGLALLGYEDLWELSLELRSEDAL